MTFQSTVEPRLSVPLTIRNDVQKFLKQVVLHVIHRVLCNKGKLSKKYANVSNR